jgi:hypothetical protein
VGIKSLGVLAFVLTEKASRARLEGTIARSSIQTSLGLLYGKITRGSASILGHILQNIAAHETRFFYSCRIDKE